MKLIPKSNQTIGFPVFIPFESKSLAFINDSAKFAFKQNFSLAAPTIKLMRVTSMILAILYKILFYPLWIKYNFVTLK